MTSVPFEPTAASEFTGHKASTKLELKTGFLADWAAAIGRIGLASLFLWSGYGKFANATPGKTKRKETMTTRVADSTVIWDRAMAGHEVDVDAIVDGSYSI